MSGPRLVGVIPSRWGSTRFPGKSLALIAGKPLLVRVIERVQQAKRLNAIYVATDDERIAAAARAAGAQAVMTRPDHPTGTDRIHEAIAGTDAEIIVNIQGDEPLISPTLIDQVGGALADEPGFDMATAATPIHTADELHSPDVVKAVCAADGGALYFSRAPIPFIRGAAAGFAPVPGLHLRHIGIYAYRRAALHQLVAAPPCALEEQEKLEQLRALHLGLKIRVLQTGETGIGVDTPEDVPRVEAILRKQGSA